MPSVTSSCHFLVIGETRLFRKFSLLAQMKLVRWDVEGPRDGVNTAVDLRSRSYPEGIAIWCNPLFKSSKTPSRCLFKWAPKISSYLITWVVIIEMWMCVCDVMKNKAIGGFFCHVIMKLIWLTLWKFSVQNEPRVCTSRQTFTETAERVWTWRVLLWVQTRSVSLSAASSRHQWIYWSL